MKKLITYTMDECKDILYFLSLMDDRQLSEDEQLKLKHLKDVSRKHVMKEV